MELKSAFSFTKFKIGVVLIIGILFIFLSGFCAKLRTYKFGSVQPRYTECLNYSFNNVGFWISLVSIFIFAYIVMSIISLVYQKSKS